MTVILHAHKNGIPQNFPAVVDDYPISFKETKVNVGNVWNPTTGVLTLPYGYAYEVQISLNVVNPNDGGKYEAFLRRGPAQVGLQGSRMSGTSDTVYASNSIVVYGGEYVPSFQHSCDTGGKQIDGQEFATWLIVRRFCEIEIDDPLRWGTTGPVCGGISMGSYTYIERRNPIEKGATVTAIGNFSDVAGAFPLKIVRYRPGYVDEVVAVTNTHDGGGFRDAELSSPWTEPNDGYNYYLAAVTTNQTMSVFNNWPRSYAVGNISGNNVAVVDQAAGSSFFVVGVRATYA